MLLLLLPPAQNSDMRVKTIEPSYREVQAVRQLPAALLGK